MIYDTEIRYTIIDENEVHDGTIPRHSLYRAKVTRVDLTNPNHKEQKLFWSPVVLLWPEGNPTSDTPTRMIKDEEALAQLLKFIANSFEKDDQNEFPN